MTSCTRAVEGLGESEGAFIPCGRCVVASLGDRICDFSAATQAGEVSCPSVCRNEKAGRASEKFRDDFSTYVAQPGSSETVCNGTGTLEWAAADDVIGHRMGEPGPNGSWVCDPCNESWHLVYGPNVDLPAGRYRAGLRNVRISGAIVDPIGNLEVGYSPDIWPYLDTVTQSDFQGGMATEIAIEFELLVPESDVQIRWDYSQEAGTTGVSVGSLFITRLGP